MLLSVDFLSPCVVNSSGRPQVGEAGLALTLPPGSIRITEDCHVRSAMAWAWSWLEKKAEPAVLTFTAVLWPLVTGVSIEGGLHVLRLCIAQELPVEWGAHGSRALEHTECDGPQHGPGP